MLLHAVLILTISCIASAKIELPPDIQEYIADLHETCLQKQGLTEDHHGTFSIHKKTPEIMCYMECLLLESRWMNPNEEIQFDFILNTCPAVAKEALSNVLEKCHDISGGTEKCEKSYNFNECMYNADPENWFLI